MAFDLERDDWRTFRVDRLRGRVRLAGRGRHRTVPGGDPAAFVKRQLHSAIADEPDAEPGRLRVQASAAQIYKRISSRYATVEPDGEQNCIVTTRGAWSRQFLVWLALLEEPIEVLGPAELIAATAALVTRLGAATDDGSSSPS